MTTDELAATIASGNPPVLLDVRLEDDFEAAHIGGAKNTRVFEVSFLDQVSAFAAGSLQAIVVYGFGGESREAEVAAGKLRRAGYENVAVFEGGIEGWAADGREVQGKGGQPAAPTRHDGRRDLDLAESEIEWLGRNLLNKHWGRLGIREGYLEFEDGNLTGGEITIDMNAMECIDLAGHDLHDVLIAHLKNDDFFDVERFPTAKFRIHDVAEIQHAAASEPNLEISGELTLRGVTKPVRFTAVSGLTAGGSPAVQAAFAFDRTQWGVIYGSGKFFRRLAGHLVNDMIEMQLRIVCKTA